MEKKGRSVKKAGVSEKQSAPKAAAVKAKEPKAAVASKPKISPEEFYRRVEFKAHAMYITRGADHGNDQLDWFEAERAVRAELGL